VDLALLASALRTAPYVDPVRTWTYGTATCVAVRPRASMYNDVRCRKARSYCVQRCILHARGSTPKVAICPHRTLQMLKLYAAYRNLLQHAAQIELVVRHVASVNVRRCSVCECCRIQRGRLQRCRTYSARGLTCSKLETGL